MPLNANSWYLDRETAYQFWVLHITSEGNVFSQDNPVIVKGGYLMRTATDFNGILALTGDFNSTTDFEIIAPAVYTEVSLNGQALNSSQTEFGTLTATHEVSLPSVVLPDLSALTWVRIFVSLDPDGV